MIELLCKPVKKLFPKGKEKPDGFTVVTYKLEEGEHIEDEFISNPFNSREFNAIGNCLPYQLDTVVKLAGEFKETKYGNSFQVSFFRELRTNTKEGILRYLNSLNSISPLIAKRIYETFGNDVFSILDNNIDFLIKVKGITEGKIDKIEEEIRVSQVNRELITYLGNFKISNTIINDIALDGLNLRDIKKNPYEITKYGVSFKTAEQISFKEDVKTDGNIERIKSALMDVLKQEETNGNTCLHISLLEEKLENFLQESISTALLSNAISSLREEKRMHAYKNFLYRQATAIAEFSIAKNLRRLEKKSFNVSANLEILVKKEAHKEGMVFADEQLKAVITSLSNKVSIITGGPGTGKTSIIKIIIACFIKLNKDADISLIAPTGKAAKKMNESSNCYASTIHSFLRIKPMESEKEVLLAMKESESEEARIYADLVIIDETSMMDIFIAKVLLSRLSDDTKIVFVGDQDQLPSVGAGAFLRDIIDSNVIPCTKLTNVYRQGAGSNIAINAKRINQGVETLNNDEGFDLIDIDYNSIVNAVKSKYLELVDEFGVDDVCILTPMRQNIETGSNMLNESIRKCFLKESVDDRFIKGKQAIFYIGDKVINNKNTDQLSNGEVGNIIDINPVDKYIVVNFGNDNITLQKKDIDNLSLAYALTVHKSQGSEYKAIIHVADPRHSRMLKRNILYTSITRAKSKVVIIGSKEAVLTSIRTVDTQNRVSNLKFLLKKYKEEE